jgi:excisionase family DNA binding protein
MAGYATAEDPATALLLHVEDACRLMQINRDRVYRLIAAGELASLKIAGSRRIPRASIDAFIERQLAADAAARSAPKPPPRG